ncbi:peptidase M16 [Deltaproteobacteria bacterium]|nr:peptidase M16 [Deltaproteobacteria bacterium]
MIQGALDNGMRVVLLPDEGPQVAAIYLWINVGSCDEPAGFEGAAHFIEHLVFKGTEHLAVGECAGKIEAMGGDLNAWTGFDETMLHATVTSAHTADAVGVLAEMMRRATFDATELERERGVVIEEIRGGEDDVGLVVGEATYATVWPGDPYGRPIIGTARSVRTLDRDALIAFYRSHYVPANACICVAGHFDAAAIRARIEQEFAGGPPAPRRDHAPRAEAVRGGLHRIRRKLDTHVVRVAFIAPCATDVAAPTFDLLAASLGGCSAAPLVSALRAMPGCFDASVDYEAESRAGLLVIEAHVAPGAEDRALNLITETLAGITTHGIDRGDLARARASLAAERRFRRQTVDGRAHEACFYQELFGDPGAWRSYDARVAAVSDEAVNEAAAGVLRAEEAAIIALTSKRAKLAPSWAPSARSAMPTGMVRHRLASGATLLLEPDESPIGAIRIVGLGGQLSETARRAGRAALWTRTVARGGGGLSADALGRAAAGLGGSVGAAAGRSSQALRAEFPAESFGSGLELVLHTLLDPTFAPQEVEQARAAMLDDLAARDDDPGERLYTAVWAAACPGHAWGVDPAGTAASLIRLNASALQSLHRGWARPENLVVAVTGDVDAEYVKSRVEYAISKLKPGPLAATLAPITRPTEPRRLSLRSARDQAHLVVAWPGLGVRDPRAATLDLLIELLSGQSGRLFLELREAEGLAYAVSAESVEGVVGGLITCSMASDPARLDEAERRLLETVGRVAAGEIRADEVERARAAVLGAVEAELQTAGARASEAAFAERYGLDGAQYRTLLHRVASVTLPQLTALAAECLGTPLVVGRLAPR